MQVPRARAELVLSLFDRFYERVYAFLRKSTNPEVAEDLAQEVFVRLLQHPHLERLTISVSYLLKIAHNLLRRRYARATRLRELLAERTTAGEVVLPDDGPVHLDGELLEAAMGLLSDDEHNAVRLIVCEGRSYQHAAESLGVSVTTINNWKHRGLTKLRKSLGESLKERIAPPQADPIGLDQDLELPRSSSESTRLQTDEGGRSFGLGLGRADDRRPASAVRPRRRPGDDAERTCAPADETLVRWRSSRAERSRSGLRDDVA
jgi:RNA polymerase sigma-70 factor (ECF subfamily)